MAVFYFNPSSRQSCPPTPRHYMLVLSLPALLCDHFNSLVVSLAVTPFLSPFFRISLSSPALFSSVSERSFLSQLCTKAVWWRGWLQANTRPLSPRLSQWAAFAVTHPAHPRTTLILPHLILLFFFTPTSILSFFERRYSVRYLKCSHACLHTHNSRSICEVRVELRRAFAVGVCAVHWNLSVSEEQRDECKERRVSF